MFRTIATATLALVLAAPPVLADGYVLGAGRWTCAEVVDTFDNGSASRKGQFFGWLMGYWSAATFQRETGFVDIVERAGGEAIAARTLEECLEVPPETMLFRVVDEMIRNTG